jgi:hypothetical protein
MKELENNNESFSHVGNKIPFTVPSDYFEKLPMRIQNLCISQPKEGAIVPFFQIIRSQLALASGFVLLVIIAFAGYYYIQPQKHSVILSNDDYIEIVNKQIYDYDEGHLLNAVKNPINNLSPKDDLTDEMIQYLLQENIDYVTLMEQY